MARLVRATSRGTVLVQVARTSRIFVRIRPETEQVFPSTVFLRLDRRTIARA
jgi:hypothetical protein